MANVEKFVVNGVPYSISQDATEYNTLALIGKYTGRDLKTVLKDEIGTGTVWDALDKRIKNRDFSGLRVGDYVDESLTNQTAVTSLSTVRWLIAHFDPYYLCGDISKDHHIAFISSAPIAISSTYEKVANGSYVQWNTTNTNQGTADEKHPYLCSSLKEWETAFEACLPSTMTKYMLTQRVLLEERYSASGALTDSNSWGWCDIGKVWSLSETEVYGQRVWGTEGYSVGFDCQFDIFKDAAHRLNGSRVSWWLRSVRGGSSSYVCSVNCYGFANYSGATYDWVRPRVGFLLG